MNEALCCLCLFISFLNKLKFLFKFYSKLVKELVWAFNESELSQASSLFSPFLVRILVTPASRNTWKRSRDESRRRIYARKISHVYTLSLKITWASCITMIVHGYTNRIKNELSRKWLKIKGTRRIPWG